MKKTFFNSLIHSILCKSANILFAYDSFVINCIVVGKQLKPSWQSPALSQRVTAKAGGIKSSAKPPLSSKMLVPKRKKNENQNKQISGSSHWFEQRRHWDVHMWRNAAGGKYNCFSCFLLLLLLLLLCCARKWRLYVCYRN